MFEFDDATGFLLTKSMLRAMPAIPQKVDVKVNNTPQKKPVEVKVVEVVRDKKGALVATTLSGTHYLKPNKNLEYLQKYNEKQQTSILTNILSVGKEQSIMLRAINENLRGVGEKSSNKGLLAGAGVLAASKIAQLAPIQALSSFFKKTLAATTKVLAAKPLLKASRALGRASLYATPAIMAYDAFNGYQDYKQQRGYSKDQKTKLSDKVVGATAGIVNGLSETVEFLTFGLVKPASKQEIFDKANEIQNTISNYANDLMADQNSWLGSILRDITPMWELENDILSSTYDVITAIPDFIRSMQPYVEKIKEPFDVLFDAIKTIATPIRKPLGDAWKKVSDEVVEQAIRGRVGLSKDSRKYLDLRDQRNTLEKDIKANGADPKKIKQLTAVDKQLGIYAAKALQDKVFLQGNTRYSTYARQDLTYANQAIIERNAIKNQSITDQKNNIALAKQNIDSLKSKLLVEKDVAKKAQITKQIQAWELSLLNSEKQLTELEKVNRNLEKLIKVDNNESTNYKYSDGSTSSKSGGSRAWRNNNPGNIIYGDFAKKQGAIGTDGKFAIFPSAKVGRTALYNLLFKSSEYKDKTLSSAMEKYAPEKDNNDTKAYIKFLIGKVGTNKKLGQYSEEDKQKIVEGISKFEGFYEQGNTVNNNKGGGIDKKEAGKYIDFGEHTHWEMVGKDQQEAFYNYAKAYYKKTGKKLKDNSDVRTQADKDRLRREGKKVAVHSHHDTKKGDAAYWDKAKGAFDTNSAQIDEGLKYGIDPADYGFKRGDKWGNTSETHHLTFMGKTPLQQSLDKTGDKIDEFKEAIGDLASRLQQSFTDMFGSWDMLTGAITDSTSVTKEATKEAKKTGVTQDEINVLFENHALEGGKV